MKKNKLLGCLAILGMSVVGFLLANDSNQTYAEELTISNIEALHASAGETTCDQTTKEQCIIAVHPNPPFNDTSSPIFGYSTGKMVVNY